MVLAPREGEEVLVISSASSSVSAHGVAGSPPTAPTRPVVDSTAPGLIEPLAGPSIHANR
jgi:hypothetical protein